MNPKTNFLIISVLMMLTGCNQPTAKPKISTTPETKNNVVSSPSAEKPDYSQLAGEYLRSDGVYTLKILSITAAGGIDAAYFNPKPIHVGKAGWVLKDNAIVLTVELRDVNYPGSTYTLQYFPATGKLAGKYYQAVERVYYDVEFNRMK
jgi:hypothetical protein